MPTAQHIYLRYGADYGEQIDLNGATFSEGAFYMCQWQNLDDAPEMPVMLAENVYSAPTEIRAKLKERIFSILVRINPYNELYGTAYVEALNGLKQAALSGPIRIVMPRAGVGNVYVNCRCDKIGEKAVGDFLMEFTAADPMWYLDAAANSDSVDQPASGAYVPLPISLYTGTAPAEPKLVVEFLSNAQYWHYFQEVAVTNNAPYTLHYYPICITINAAALVAAGKLRADFGDFRLYSPGGAHKDIYIRNTGDPSNLKVWFILYKLDPGETKRLHLLYGAPGELAEAEPANVRQQFNGNASSNSLWFYGDSMPLPAYAQSRVQQWHRHGAFGSNIQPIDYKHPHFNASADPYVVTSFGAHATFHGPAWGYAGVEFTGLLDITSVSFDYRHQTNGKTPMVFRTRRFGDSWQDEWDSVTAGDPDSSNRTTYPTGYYSLGPTLTWAAGNRPQSIAIGMRGDHPELTTGEWYYAAAETVTLNFDPAQVPTVTLGPETNIDANVIGTLTNSYTGEALSIFAKCSPGDTLTLDCKARTCVLEKDPDSTLTSSAALGATHLFVSDAWAFTVGHPVVVTLMNGEEFESTVTIRDTGTSSITIADALPLAANAGANVWDEGHFLNRFAGLTFPGINRYWIHIEPQQPSQEIQFTGVNLFNMRFTLSWPTLYF